MKHRRQLVILFLFTSFCGVARAQNQTHSDSLLALHIHQLSQKFALSPTQEQAFLSLERQEKKAQDSAIAINMSPENSKQWLTDNLREYDKKLKQILTADQWKDYKAMMETLRQKFIQHTKEKKIKTDEITRDN